MNDLNLYYNELTQQMMKISHKQAQLLKKQNQVYFTGRLSNLFMSLDDLLDRDERLVEGYNEKLETLDALQTRISKEQIRIERYLDNKRAA